jgi:beta-glucosidase-like glycosyl hydrolase
MGKSTDERIALLIGALPLADKIGMLGSAIDHPAGYSNATGVPSYQWWSEALHGVAYSPGVTFGGSTPFATSFPEPLSSSCSFNESLWKAVGTAVGREARAFHNEGHAGLTFWTPNINIFRDPRWGRGMETPGEDPHVNGRYAVNFVRGLQGSDDGEGVLQASACCKHYAAYSLEGNNMGAAAAQDDVDRHHFNAVVTEQDLTDTYYPAFEACVGDGHASGLMCSYNEVNGVPSCADAPMLALTRDSWGFDGYITGDCGAIDDISGAHKYASYPAEAALDALQSGVDLDCGGFLQRVLPAAVANGTVAETLIDTALSRLFRVQFRLGYFDPPERVPWSSLSAQDVNTPAHKALAYEAAAQSLVLLENKGGVLPLAQGIGSVAVVGPLGNEKLVFLGNYNGIPEQISSVLEGVSAHAADVSFAAGCDDGVACTSIGGADQAATLAATADATIIAIGLNTSIEAEGLDRTELTLPGQQDALVEAVCAKATGPVVLVVVAGGAIDIRAAVAKADAVLYAGYTGQSAGAAIGDALFGVFSPSGRLTQTWYPNSFADTVQMTNMAMRPDVTTGYPGRTYRFYTGETVYKFGHGLSYANVVYSEAAVETVMGGASESVGVRRALAPTSFLRMPADSHGALAVCIRVSNQGDVASDEVVLLFHVPPKAEGRAARRLVAFERIHLKAGEARVIRFELSTDELEVPGADGVMAVPEGAHGFEVGGEHMATHLMGGSTRAEAH